MRILLRAEKIIFYLLVFCLPLQVRHIFHFFGQTFNEWQAIYLYATDILILGLLGLWLLRILSGREKIKFGWPEICLGALGLIAFLSIFAAANRSLAIFSVLKLLEFLALFLYVKYNFSSLFKITIFWKAFVVGALVQGGVALIQFLKQQSLGLKFLHESPLAFNLPGVAKIVVNGQPIIRAYGLVPHPNILAAILVAAIFGLVWLITVEFNQSSVFKKIVNVFFLAVLASALFFTFSRGVIAVGYLFLFLWLAFLFKDKQYRKQILFLAIFLLAVNCLLLVVFWPYAASRYSVGDFLGGQSVNLRSFYNQAAIRTIMSHPLLGVGQGNFVTALAQKYIDLASWAWQPVHNIYLLAASEIGIFGLLAFLGFLFLTIKGAWQRKLELDVSHLLFAIGYLLVIGLFDHFLWDLQQGQLLFWMILGILGAHGSTDPALKNASS